MGTGKLVLAVAAISLGLAPGGCGEDVAVSEIEVSRDGAAATAAFTAAHPTRSRWSWP